jgi:hypothetical protein
MVPSIATDIFNGPYGPSSSGAKTCSRRLIGINYNALKISFAIDGTLKSQ